MTNVLSNHIDVSTDVQKDQRCDRMFLKKFRGYTWFFAAFASAASYSCMTLTIRSLPEEIGSVEMLTVRALMSTVLSFIVICYNGTGLFAKRDFMFHSANSLLTAGTIFAQFYAYQNMPVADACAIIYGYVALTGVFARIILKEPFGYFEVTSVLFTFVGIVLISRPSFLFQFVDDSVAVNEIKSLLPPLVAFSGAVLAALHQVILRKMGRSNISSMQILFCANLPTFLVAASITTLSRQWTVPSCSWVRFRMVLTALGGHCGYLFLTIAMNLQQAVYVSLIVLNEVFIVFVISVSFFGFTPKWTSLVGIGLVTGASVIIMLRQIVQKVTDKNPGTKNSGGAVISELEDNRDIEDDTKGVTDPRTHGKVEHEVLPTSHRFNVCKRDNIAR